MEIHLISLARVLINLQYREPAEACLLTFHMGEEVVSEGGVGTGVAVGGAEAAGAQVRQPLHTRRQKLCAARIGQGEGKQKRTEINTGAGKVALFQGRKKER